MPTLVKKNSSQSVKKIRQEKDRETLQLSVLEEKAKDVIHVGVIGCGYWGPNLIRNLHELAQVKIEMICDRQQDRLLPFAKKIPGVKLTTQDQDIFKNPDIDAVVIATPITTHYPLVSQALKSKKHVLVEKPLTATAQEGKKLIEQARRANRILMVGHTFEYNPAVRKVSELLKAGEIGQLYYIDSVRVNLGRHQTDGMNVVWDLAPHDISIILKWVGKMPLSVSAHGQSYVQSGIEDVAFIRLEFEGGIVAHIHVSWLAPAKIRRMTLVGNKKMVIYDDLENVEKIKIADQAAHLNLDSRKNRIAYRMGDIVSPRLDVDEPLSRECAHFVDCIINQRRPESDDVKGLQVVQVLEAASRSIKKGGAKVSIK